MLFNDLFIISVIVVGVVQWIRFYRRARGRS